MHTQQNSFTPRGFAPRLTARLRAAVFIGLVLIVGCSTAPARHPVPDALVDVARVPGMPPDVRAWGDHFSPAFQRSAVDSISEAFAAYGERPPTDMLAISGGGSNGAFAAGLLCGWSEAGNRPTFRLVTGVSVGAVIAPFAFLGSSYDEKLKQLAASVSDEKISRPKPFPWSLAGDSVADARPLVELLKSYYDQKLLAAIAAEHAKGRRLYVGTTDLDSGRPVIWDLGAIAASGSPDSLKVFRQVILASAAIPVLWSPVYIRVEANGKRYDEMHVDGGVTAQMILYGNVVSMHEVKRQLPASELLRKPEPTVYVIRNGKFTADRQTVDPKVLSIAGRAVGTLVIAQAMGDIYRLHAVCRRDGLEFRLASIPADLKISGASPFDPKAIQALYARGYELGRAGYRWATEPPGLSPESMRAAKR